MTSRRVLKSTLHYCLSHVVAPNVTSISTDQEVASPAPVSLNCTVNSYPPSDITWFHDGAEVQAALPRVIVITVQVNIRTQKSTLTVLNTILENIGTYTCSAVNSEGMTNKTTELLVLGEWGKLVRGWQVQWVRDMCIWHLSCVWSTFQLISLSLCRST